MFKSRALPYCGDEWFPANPPRSKRVTLKVNAIQGHTLQKNYRSLVIWFCQPKIPCIYHEWDTYGIIPSISYLWALPAEQPSVIKSSPASNMRFCQKLITLQLLQKAGMLCFVYRTDFINQFLSDNFDLSWVSAIFSPIRSTIDWFFIKRHNMDNFCYLRKLENLSNLVCFEMLKQGKHPPTHARQRQSISHHEAKFCKTEWNRVKGSRRKGPSQQSSTGGLR